MKRWGKIRGREMKYWLLVIVVVIYILVGAFVFVKLQCDSIEFVPKIEAVKLEGIYETSLITHIRLTAANMMHDTHDISAEFIHSSSTFVTNIEVQWEISAIGKDGYPRIINHTRDKEYQYDEQCDCFTAKTTQKLWILLWSSTQSLDGSEYFLEQIDHYSVRASSGEILQWMNLIEKHGKGYNFYLVKGEQIDYQQIRERLEKEEIRP